ncbi:MAG: DUF1643 domain-containing protein [Actinomycetes bacterium]
MSATEPEERTAVVSNCGRYRYLLIRRWASGPLLTLVLLNPSTADAATDDRTVCRCRGFARAHGLAGMQVLNLYAYRTREPRQLWQVADPVGPDNDHHLTRAGATAHLLVAGWGTRARPERVHAVLGLPGFDRLWVLGLTRAGLPRHPLYLPSAARPHAWPPSPESSPRASPPRERERHRRR